MRARLWPARIRSRSRHYARRGRAPSGRRSWLGMHRARRRFRTGTDRCAASARVRATGRESRRACPTDSAGFRHAACRHVSPLPAREPRIGAAFGAVAVDHVGRNNFARAATRAAMAAMSRGPELAAHRHAGQPEREHRRQRRQRRFGLRAAAKMNRQPGRRGGRALPVRAPDRPRDGTARRPARAGHGGF